VDVVIDGVRYSPTNSTTTTRPSIGIGVTTRDRRDVFTRAFAEIEAHAPAGAVIVVVDDASEKPVDGATFRFDQQAGIARAKNKCIELLTAAGCEHMFLFDDDTWPIVDDWWQPYVASPEPHLMYLFKDVNGTRHMDTPRTAHEDAQHIALTHPRGAMLYIDRRVVDTIGGMRPEFGTWGWEHVEFSSRVHSAGLTTWRFADVVGSAALIYSMDEHYTAHAGFERSVPIAERQALVGTNEALVNHYAGSTDYVEFRQPRDVVLSVFITGGAPVDPQRKTALNADSALLDTYTASLASHDVVILNDELPAAPHLERVPTITGNPYLVRWIHAWRWLRDHPETRFAWVTDCTDVELLHDPFPHMVPGRLYLGSEPTTVGCDWLRTNHPSLKQFIDAHANKTLVNGGLVGGDRATMLRFLGSVLNTFWDTDPGKTDMGAINLVAWTQWADRLEYGPKVHTVFKAFDTTNPHAWFRHK
jgi:hypothetical protein